MNILENGMVSVEFTFGEEPYVFRDAIVMTPEEYSTYAPEQIQAMQQARYDAWLKAITPPSQEEIDRIIAEQSTNPAAGA